MVIKQDKALIRKIQLVELELLKEVDRICRKNGIEYSLEGGTLLGAIRHDGFIPWDNDADIVMTREEYKKFAAACKKDLNHDKFFLQDYHTEKTYRWGYPKLRYNDTQFLMPGQEKSNWHLGICIDIFPYDGVPDNYVLRRLHLFACFFVRKGLYSFFGKNNADNILLRGWYSVLNFIPLEVWRKAFNWLVCISNKVPHQMCRHLAYPYRQEAKYGMSSKIFDGYMDKEFEGYRFRILKNYDLYLRTMYGDYMELPPLEKRKPFPLIKLKLSNESLEMK